MLRRLSGNKGQMTLEVAMLFAVVAAALLAINVYMNRGIQGKLKSSTDDIGEQYHAGKVTGAITVSDSSQTHETFQHGITTNAIEQQHQGVAGSESVLGF